MEGLFVKEFAMSAEKKSSPFVLLILLATTAGLVVTSVFLLRQTKAVKAAVVREDHSSATPVRVTSVERRIIRHRAKLHGFLAPFVAVAVSAGVAGEIVAQQVDVSANVEAGQTLFQIDHAVQTIEHEKALASLDYALSEYDLAKAHWERIQGLDKEQVSPIERKEGETKYLSAKARMRQAEAAVDLSALMLEQTSVRSPMRGVVSRLHFRLGEFVQPGRPLVELIEIDRLKLFAEIEDDEVVWVRVGQRVLLTSAAFPGEPFEGKVHRVYPEALKTSRKFEVEIELANPDRRLRPGFFMTGSIVKPATDELESSVSGVLVVPREAVVQRYARHFCFVVRAVDSPVGASDSRLIATRTPVTVFAIPSAPRLLRIVDGVDEGDLVVTKGQQHMSEQTHVRIED